ncbi:MAG: hypothetical protein ACRCT8_08005 [Lacipirellulaceae bacterium]
MKLDRLVSAALLVALVTSCRASFAQDETFGWDGETNGNWFTTTNWTVFGANPNPGLGDPPIPDAGTRVEIDTDGLGVRPAPSISTGDALAHQVRIGLATPGVLNMSGGSLTTSPGTITFRVGAGAPGTLNLSGGTLNVAGGTMVTGSGVNSRGQVTVTGGTINVTGANRDFNLDEALDAATAASNLTMSAGVISIADVLLIDNMASIDLSGGTITSAVEQAGATRIRRDGAVRVSGGLFETKDDLEFGNATSPGGSLAITGGAVRAFRISDVGATASITVNGSGVLQVASANESTAAMQARVTSGLISSSGALAVSTVNVGGTNYTQVAVAAPVLLGDYNNNGVVDAADYTVWRDGLGGPSSVLNGRGSGAATVVQADYDLWVANYGRAGSFATAIPEPLSAAILTVGLALTGVCGRRR